MRKTYKMFAALMLCMMGALNVSAVTVSLQEVPFWTHEIWGVDEPKTTEAECAWVVGESTGLPYGDTSVINFADLTTYTKLIVTVTDGTPRFLFNRDVDEGQFNDDESQSHLIDNTRGGWCAKYFSSEPGEFEGETVYTVDLKQLVKDKGYAHLHAIKGANWSNVTVTDMVVERQGKGGLGADFSNDVILLDFGFDTNVATFIPQDAMRAFFDKSCASVKVNGQSVELYSIEGLKDGRFYVFLDEAASESDVVEVSFTNTIGLIYTSGPSMGSAVEDFTVEAEYNYDVEDDEIYPEPYPYDYVTPVVMKADPEDGSFNLDNNTTFTIYFDKEVDCEALVATINGQAMSKNPAEGFAKEVVLDAGSLANGLYTIEITKIYPKMRLADDIFGEYSFTVNVGEVVFDPNDQPEELIPLNNFNDCAAGGIPEGFQVKFGEEMRISGESYGSGSRMFTFSEGGDFTKGLYYREGYVETAPALEFTANKNYVITFNLSNWKGSNTSAFQVLDTDENVLFERVITAAGVANGNQNIVLSGTTKAEISFVPEESGSYILRWVSNGFVELLLANVKVEYQPNTPGMKEMLALNAALEAARKTLEENSSERYLGTAFDNLQTVIGRYENWKSSSPSEYAEAVEALNEAAQALKDHRSLCDEYDTQVKKAIDVVRQNAANKFANTDLYAELVGIVSNYNGTSEWVNEGDDENPVWQLYYNYDELKEDGQLESAVAELKDIANLTSLLFTEGVSAPENANGGKGTGVAVLVERLRLGAETLKALGASETEPALEAFANALTDDDALADMMKQRITDMVYNNLSDPANTMFEGVVDENTLEEVTPTYDMTVFVKNPNTYKQLPNSDFTEENVPGWIVPEGYSRPGLTHGWGAYYNIDGVAEDCMFQTWGSSYRVEQTIEDLPAGTYTVRFAFGERNNGDAGVFEDSYAYTVTSDGLETMSNSKGTNDNGEEMFIAGIGQAFPFANNDNQVAIVENVVVTDGTLTIGVNAGPSSHTFFNEVRILLTAPAPGFEYTATGNPCDLNGDGKVNALDIQTIINACVDSSTDSKFDINKDGKVNALDIQEVINAAAAAARKLGIIID